MPRRLLVLFTPNGTILDEFFAPSEDGSVQLGRILSPLAPYRDRLSLLDGLSMGVTALGPGNEHQRGMAAWLTGQPNNDGTFCGGDQCVSGRSGWASGPSIDQLVAQRHAGETPLPSLELGVRVEGPNNRHRMSFSGAELPVAPDHDPRSVYRRLFGQSAAELERQECVSDRLAAQYRELAVRVSGPDRERMSAHLAAVEAIETRVQALASLRECAAQPAQPPALDVMDEVNYGALTQLQTELLVAAFRCDVTRVASLMWSGATAKALPRWVDGKSFADLAFDSPLSHGFHSYTHDPFRDLRDAEQVETRLKLLVIYRWYAAAVARLLASLDSVVEADGSTLLDNTLVIWGSELASPDVHSFDRMPFVLAGGSKFLNTGRYRDYHGEQHTALLATLGLAFGLPDARFGHRDFARKPLYELLR
ncbi:MAG TPA: DUF1552 domain-containing protein [Polyangiales bacterium]|nr:DUF1552 domain-containing protein [Polyangiales bacterium]